MDAALALRALVEIQLAVADIKVLSIAQEDVIEKPPDVAAFLSRLLAILLGRIDGRFRKQFTGGGIEPAEPEPAI